MPTTLPTIIDKVNTTVPVNQVIGVDHAYLTISLATAIVVVAALLGFTWKAARAAYAAERTNHHLANIVQKFEALVVEVRDVITNLAVLKAHVEAIDERLEVVEKEDRNSGSGNGIRARR